MKRQQENTTNVIFSGRLAEQMKARGITQQDLASAGGCTQSAISLYLKGRIPSGEVLVKLARALGTTAEALCGFQPLPKNEEVHEWRRKAEVALGKVAMLKSGMEGLLKKI
jgi:transcriptional regulator with XRE-family HTH domain